MYDTVCLPRFFLIRKFIKVNGPAPKQTRRLAPIEDDEDSRLSELDDENQELAALNNPRNTKPRFSPKQPDLATVAKQLSQLCEIVKGMQEAHKCWNCESAEHFSKDCPEPKKPIECYKCKAPGVISTNCPNCKKEKNT